MFAVPLSLFDFKKKKLKTSKQCINEIKRDLALSFFNKKWHLFSISSYLVCFSEATTFNSSSHCFPNICLHFLKKHFKIQVALALVLSKRARVNFAICYEENKRIKGFRWLTEFGGILEKMD